jgi:hypothetical protein
MGVTPQIAKKILDANLINLANKVKEGKALSSQELSLVQSVASEGEGVGVAYVQNQTDLAKTLNIKNRKTIQRWLKMEGNPGTAADGRYSVVAWREWKKKHGRFGDEDEDTELDRTYLQAKNLLLQNQRLEIQVAALRKETVPFADVEQWGADLGVAIRKVISQWHLIAPNLAGLTVPEIEERLKEGESEVLHQLHLLDENIQHWKETMDIEAANVDEPTA